MKNMLCPALILCSLLCVCCTNNPETPDASGPTAVPVMSFSITASLPHDTSFFTEGLEFYKGSLLESTGLEKQSKLVLYNPATGAVERSINLPATEFGEGVSVMRDTVYQLTYQSNKVNVYTGADFKKIKDLPFTGEGWGLTHDSTAFIASNGSSNLYYYQPGTFKLLKTVAVTEAGVPAVNINELEYINGFVYANQWQMDYILKINPTTGEVVAKLNLADMVKQVRLLNPHAEVLNGIAYNPQTKKVYVTGKNWPQRFEIQFAY